ncbi:MAG: NAD(P)/FAD-dependent oxidoreductase, partial [Gammaproteobacteria bacterium]
MSNQPKVTIIGAGIIGVCCALELQRAGCQVTLIDREEPGEGCSKGNAGVFAYDAVLPLITPGLLRRLPSMLFDPMSPLALGWRHLPFALPWMSRFLLNALPNRVSANTNALTQLLSRGEQAYEDLLQGTEARGLVHKTGWATVFEKEQTYRASLHEVEIKRRQGVRIETLSGGALRERLPDLNPEVKHGLFMPDCWSTVDPHRLVELLAKQLIRDGAGFRRAEVSAISEKGGVPHIVTESGDEPCERLLVATGAWSKKLAASAGDAIPLDTERGYHLMVQGNGINPAMPVMSGEHHFVTT